MPVSDLLVCAENELLAIVNNAEDPYGKGAWFMAKRISGVELSILGELLGVGTYAELQDGFDIVGEPLPEGPWPQRVPPALSQRLAALADTEIRTVCARWVASEEFAGWRAESLETYLRDVRAFLQANPGPVFLVDAL